MVYSFSIVGRDRNLRFLWFLDKDLSKELFVYRMCKHIFGNSPSSSMATYCLRKSVPNLAEDVRKLLKGIFMMMGYHLDRL